MMTRSIPLLSEAARHLVIPGGIVSTGFARVERRLVDMGTTFDWWQRDACRVALGRRADGKYAATVGGVVWSLCRQIGKTFTVGSLLIALCLEFPGLRVVWTSHHLRTTTNTFRSMQGMVRKRRVAAHLAPNGIRVANGEQEIRFTNGSIIMFGAREQGFGRGMDAIDVLVFDEAQKLGEKALEDMVPATNAAKHPHGALLFFLGTPPRPVDEGEAFSNKRAKALAGKSADMMYLELSADPDADPDDRAQWARANLSFPDRTPLESMLRMRENLGSDEAWMREALGVWDAVDNGGVIPPVSWSDCADPLSFPVDRYTLGVECGPDLGWASVALAGQREDLSWHVELEDDQHTKGRGVDWLVPALQNLLVKNPQVRGPVADVAGPIKAMLEQRGAKWFFKGSRLEVTPLRVSDVGGACSSLLSGVVSGGIRHIGQPQLTAATLAAGKRALGDTGLWVWQRKNATSDITPVQAMTWALWGAQNSRVRRQQGKQRRVVVMS